MTSIYEFDQKDLENYFLSVGDKKFRAVQILEWLYRHQVSSFDEMTNLSVKASNLLKEKFSIESLNLTLRQESKDGTVKYLFT